MNITQAKAIVTGGSTGIGNETAKSLVEKGAEVVICSRDESEIKSAGKAIGATGIQADVTDEQSVKQLFAQATKKLGGLNVVINNAGIGYMNALTDTPTDDFTHIWETNVKGAFMVGREAAAHFIPQEGGHIINVSSTAGHRGYANGTAYCASKFALEGMTQCWRDELRSYHIRVMQVNPSEVITPFATKLGFEPDNADRKLKPAQIAHAMVSMLEMDDVGFIPGAEIWATNPTG